MLDVSRSIGSVITVCTALFFYAALIRRHNLELSVLQEKNEVRTDPMERAYGYDKAYIKGLEGI